MHKPVLQVALDFVDTARALSLAEEAYAGGARWLEIGTPLIKSEGLNAVRIFRERFPEATLIADMKTMDAGRIEVETAGKAGAHIVCVLGAASDSTIRECVEAGSSYGVKIFADMIQVPHPALRAKELEAMGVDIVGFHISIDEQMCAHTASLETMRAIAKSVAVPVACAGGLNSVNIPQVIAGGARVIVVGGAITKSADAKLATRRIMKVIATGKPAPTAWFVRGDERAIQKILKSVSSANVSDAMHRKGHLPNVHALVPGARAAGRAFTVRTMPGDWAKPVEAIDRANPGDVLVIDAGGTGPAVWGELATHSAIQKGLAGVVVWGGVRDIEEIRKLRFPVFACFVTPQAGEPKGIGESDVVLRMENTEIKTGDWVIGDSDGVVVIPHEKSVEIANRSSDVLERENRIREEIRRGSTLSRVAELLKWEKK